jgi:hypothetical protein
MSPRWPARQARTASPADPKTAIRPSPVVLTTCPPAPITEVSRIESWRSSARLIACGKASHKRVLPSMSLNRKVKVPDALSGSMATSLRPLLGLKSSPHAG